MFLLWFYVKPSGITCSVTGFRTIGFWHNKTPPRDSRGGAWVSQNYSSPYLVLNFSTRPPLVVNFWVPVKNGWHAEQMSVLISDSVDLVINVLPHAQVTLHSLYSGWIPFFMLLTSFLPSRAFIEYHTFHLRSTIFASSDFFTVIALSGHISWQQ